MSTKTVLCVVGARPNFMKIAPIMHALEAEPRLEGKLVHTGQHYDPEMSESFFRDLGIPAPGINLNVSAGSMTVQTAEIMVRFEEVIQQARPDCLLVVGDVTSTVACALTAVRHDIPVAHVEAGLRSYDRRMPEEINRVLTDQLSTFLFTSEEQAAENLAREGIAHGVHFVGNVMIDTLKANLERAVAPAQTLGELGLSDLAPEAGQYALLTLHRPSNVDDPVVFADLLAAVREVSRQCPVFFPVHPRTRARIDQFGLASLIAESRIHILPPLGYLSMLGFMRDARFVATDSGGVQEETTALGVPCFTLRENTERPITVSEGTNTLVGPDGPAFLRAVGDLWATGGKSGRVPKFWDGRTATRVADLLAAGLSRAGCRE